MSLKEFQPIKFHDKILYPIKSLHLLLVIKIKQNSLSIRTLLLTEIN